MFCDDFAITDGRPHLLIRDQMMFVFIDGVYNEEHYIPTKKHKQRPHTYACSYSL